MEAKITYKKIWQTTYPVILSALGQNIINFTDTAFLARVGEVELGASAIGGLLYLMFFVVGFGLGTGTQILIARRVGSQSYTEVGKIFDHSLLIGIGLGVLLFSIMKFFSPLFLGAMLESPAILSASLEFLDYRSWGIFFASCNVIFRAFYIGTASTQIITWTTCIMALVNAALGYGLVFGEWGFPEMGIRGAAIASVTAEFSAILFFACYTLLRVDLTRYNLFRLAGFKSELFKNILSISVPVMLQYLISLGGWFIFFIIIEQMGERELAISNIVRSVYMLLMVPVWGFAATTNTMVSNIIGQGRSDEVMKLIKKLIVMSLGCTLIFFTIGTLFPREIILLYTNNDQLIQDCLPSLKIITYSLIEFSIVWIWFSALSGTGDTKGALVNEIITIAIYLAYSYYIVIIYKGTVEAAWTAEFVYFTIIGVLSYWMIKRGRWKKIKV